MEDVLMFKSTQTLQLDADSTVTRLSSKKGQHKIEVSTVDRTGIFLTGGERLVRGYTKFDFTVDEGQGRLNPSRDKN